MLMMLDAIRGMLSTVAVTSRKAYKSLSAGASVALCPTIAIPVFATVSRNSSADRSVRKPLIDSNLSTVPPVCPSPRPLIFATVSPKDATIGETISEVLSPTPPVECLSTRNPEIPVASKHAPESRMASVSAVVSAASMPRNQIAIQSAAA